MTNGHTAKQAPITTSDLDTDHPLGPPQHSAFVQFLRIIGFGSYFLTSCLFIHFAQLLGAPLYFINRDYFDTWMALTKSYFGILVTTMTSWFSPTVIRISGDASMRDLIHQDAAGLLRMELGERVVLMANHQLYTDWLYLWWISYTNTPPTHGHVYIILKESLKYVPIIGPAMQFFGFVFMARKWSSDQERMRFRLQKLSEKKEGGSPDPMYLLIFPEGTNISANTRRQSEEYCAKQSALYPDQPPMQSLRHQILPRSTGLQFCLNELGDTIEYLYDCTIAYEGIPPGQYGQDIFTLRSVYFQGRPPKSVNMHFRRIPISTIPLGDKDEMYAWTLARWREKDDLLEAFYKTGKFPASTDAVKIEGGPQEKAWKTAYINTEVKPRSPVEFLQIFAPVAAAATVGRVGVQILDRVFGMGSLI